MKEKYFFFGPWNEYGYINFSGGDEVLEEGAARNLIWHYYLTFKSMAEKKSVNVYDELYQNGKLLAVSSLDRDVKFDVNNTWKENSNSFVLIKSVNDHRYMTNKELTDGKYQIKQYTDKNVRVFNFIVKDGKIALEGRQDRRKTPSLYVIEDMNTGWWIQQEGGVYLKK